MSILETVEDARSKNSDMMSEEEFNRVVLHNDIPINLPYEVYRAQSILKDALTIISELENEVNDLMLRLEDLEHLDSGVNDFLSGFKGMRHSER